MIDCNMVNGNISYSCGDPITMQHSKFNITCQSIIMHTDTQTDTETDKQTIISTL